MPAKPRIRKNRYKHPRTVRRRWGMKLPLGFCLKSTGGLCLLGLMSMTLIFMHDLLTQCRYFDADTIQISGAQRIDREMLLQQANIQAGQNVLSINLSLARARLLSHPWISDVDIQRILPNKLFINIREHHPVAVLDLKRHFLVDARGAIFKECEPGDADGLPLIKGLDYSDLNTPGQPQSRPFAAVMTVLHLYGKKSSVLAKMGIKEIEVDRDIGLTLISTGRAKSIHLGYGDYREKLVRMEQMMAYIEKDPQFTGIDMINLVNPNRIVIRPAEMVSSADTKGGAMWGKKN